MSDWKNQKRSRVESGLYDGTPVLELYVPGANPHFTPANGNMLEADSRVPQKSQIVETKSVLDQNKFQEKEAENTATAVLGRIQNVKMDYKKVGEGGSTPTIAVVNIRDGTRPLYVQSPICRVVYTNIKGDVCLEKSTGTGAATLLSPTDYDGIMRTEWEMVLNAQSIEDEEHDGDSRNRYNFHALKFFEKLRRLENKLLHMIAQQMIGRYDKDTERTGFLPELVCNSAITAALEAGDADLLVDAICKVRW